LESTAASFDSIGTVFSTSLQSPIPLAFGGEALIAGVTGGDDSKIAVMKPGGSPTLLADAPTYFSGYALASEERAMILWVVSKSSQSGVVQTIHYLVVDRNLELVAGPAVLAQATDSPGPGDFIRLRGVPLGERFAITWRNVVAVLGVTGEVIAIQPLAASPEGGLGIASDGASILLSWIEDGAVFASTLTSEGEEVRPPVQPFPAAAARGTLAVSWTGAAYAIAWSEVTGAAPCRYAPLRSVIRSGEVDRSARAVGGTSSVSAGEWNETPHLVSVERETILVWSSGSPSPDPCQGVTRWLRASPAGADIAVVSGFLVPRSQSSPAIASDGFHAVAVWEEETGPSGTPRIFASSFAIGGHRRFEGVPLTAAGSGIQTSPAVSFDGVRFLVAWIERNGSGRTIRARFLHPVDGPSDAVLQIASLHDEAKNEYEQRLNASFLALAYAGGMHHVVWIDGLIDQAADTYVQMVQVAINGTASRARTLSGPWTAPYGIDAAADGGEVSIAFTVRSSSGDHLYAGPARGTFESRTSCSSRLSCGGMYIPRITTFGGSSLITWQQGSVHNPFFGLLAMTGDASAPATLNGYSDSSSYDVVPVSDEAQVYWILYDVAHAATLVSSLALEGTTRLFPARQIAATRHRAGVALATAEETDNGAIRVFVHLPVERSEPRRRAVRR
ncbi:MAG: hypothetical protein LC732_01005, partial [Acidobacteria bacterium]|nr:hypothetical protein [Acidobacteriota bacterium]